MTSRLETLLLEIIMVLSLIVMQELERTAKFAGRLGRS